MTGELCADKMLRGPDIHGAEETEQGGHPDMEAGSQPVGGDLSENW